MGPQASVDLYHTVKLENGTAPARLCDKNPTRHMNAAYAFGGGGAWVVHTKSTLLPLDLPSLCQRLASGISQNE